MSNVSCSGVSDKQRRGQFASISLAVLIAAVLAGCSVTPEASKPQVRKAVAKQNNTYVVRHTSVRTPGTERARKLQQQSWQRAAAARKKWQQAQAKKRQQAAGHASRKRVLAHNKQTPARQAVRGRNGQSRLSSAQYHARYKAQQQAAAKAALQRRHAKVRALAAQQRAKQQAVRKQHLAKWKQQQNKRLQFNNSWKHQQAQKAINVRKAAQMARRRPATPATKPWVKPRPAPRAVARVQQPNRQKYVARWNHMQAEKRLQAQRAKEDRRLQAQRVQAGKRLKAQKAAQKVEQVIHNAKKQIGRKYVWGGASPKRGFDCSGLVQHSIKKGANVKVPRTAAQQYKAAVKVPKHQAQRGDLVFFITRGKSVSHVGIYLGNNKFVHAPRTGKRVTTANLSGYWKKRFVGFGRIPGACRLPV